MSNIQQNDDKLILSDDKPKENNLTEQRRQSKKSDNVTENKLNLGSISSSNAFALKKNDQEEVEADEEDNSQEQYSSDRQRVKKPAHLNILKYDQSQPDEDLQSPSIRQNQVDSSDNNSDTAPEMVTRDLSPLSPQKKGRHLGMSKDSEHGGYRPRGYSNANESQDFEQFAADKDPYQKNQQDISGAFKLKGTVDISTAGPQVTQQSLNKVTDLITGSNENLKGQVVRQEVNAIPANPILPKTVHTEQKKPPECPLKDIQFVQLKKFLRFKDMQLCKMGEGFDQIGKKNMMRENREKRRKYEDQMREEAARKGRENEDQAKMDEYTHIIQNIVYARDPKIFDTKNGFVNQRAAFMHENMLDIKNLIRMNEERNGANERFGHRAPPPKRYIKTKQEIERDRELEAKARYSLRTHEDGTIDRRDKTLLFESKFESGNLYLAQKVSDNEYNLLMQNDINTSGHTQWFYYQVKNTRKNLTVTFKIMNFTKPDSLFNYGMKVSVYSEKRAEQEDLGWHKGGERISYYGNGIKKDITYTSKGYYTASFQYTFKHDDDVVYFAYCFPYTYTDMMNDIYEIEKDSERRKICTRKTLCKTLAGVDCEILTVTEKGDFEVMQKKKAVVISARVHPGEVVGSWMMRGVLFFLTDPENEEAKMLREKFIFKIIPMLNPDGVINGNYRCSLAGCDLNRRWKTPHQRLHPTIYHTKKLIIDIHKERGVILYCDLHGHSRKQNVFMYGCNNKLKPEECRVYPLILSKLSKYFHFGSCRFGVQKSKESTARVSLYKELKNCPNIFTMESTFSGVDFGDAKGEHMTTASFESMGTDLCRVLLIYENIFIPPELRHLYGKQEENSDQPPDMSALFEQELQENKKLIAAGEGDSSGGSDSEPSEDNLPVEQVAKVVPIVDDKQKKQLQKIIKKREKEAKEEEKQKKEPKKKPEESPARSPIPGQRGKSPTKKTQEIIQVKPVEEKKAEPAAKKKPEMKDAQTQTDRSDYQRIKKQQQQARMMQEMKDQQARLRQQAQQQLKSGTLVETNQMRKQPQSQTAQRDHITPSNYHNFGVTPYQPKNNQYQVPPERHLQDMRDNPQKYQFSKDKQQLYQTPQKMPFQNQSIIQSPKNNDGSNRPSLQGINAPGNHIVLKPNAMIPANQGSPGQSHVVYQKYDKNQSGQNKNVVINMSQINTVNSGLIAPNQNMMPGQGGLQSMNPVQSQQMKFGIPTINRNMAPQMMHQSPTPGGLNPNFQGRNMPPNQTMNNGLPGSVIKKNDGINILDIVDRQNANPNPQQQNLRGAGSTISKAGEQILQKQSNFKSPKKSGQQTQNIQQNNQNKSKQHELRFQIQSIASNALGGAIQQKGYSQGGVIDQQKQPMTNQVIIGGPPGINNQNNQGAIGMRGNSTRPVNSQSNAQYGSATRNTEQSQPGGGQLSSQKQYPPNQDQTRRESVRRRADNNNSQIQEGQQNSRNKEMKNIQLFKTGNNSKTAVNPTQNAINIQQAIVPNNQISDSTKVTNQSFDKRQKTNSISFQSNPENGVMSPAQKLNGTSEKVNTVGRIAMQNPTSLTNSPRNKDSAPKQLGGQQQNGIQMMNIGGMNVNQQNARNSSMQRSQNLTGGHRQANSNMATGEQVRQNAMSHHMAGGMITMSQNSEHSVTHKKHASQIIPNMQPQQQHYSAQAWNDPHRSKRQSGAYMNSQQSAQNIGLNPAALNSVPSQPADPTLNLSNSTPVSGNQTGGKRPKNASHNIYRMKLKSNQDTEDI